MQVTNGSRAPRQGLQADRPPIYVVRRLCLQLRILSKNRRLRSILWQHPATAGSGKGAKELLIILRIKIVVNREKVWLTGFAIPLIMVVGLLSL